MQKMLKKTNNYENIFPISSKEMYMCSLLLHYLFEIISEFWNMSHIIYFSDIKRDMWTLIEAPISDTLKIGDPEKKN